MCYIEVDVFLVQDGEQQDGIACNMLVLHEEILRLLPDSLLLVHGLLKVLREGSDRLLIGFHGYLGSSGQCDPSDRGLDCVGLKRNVSQKRWCS